MQRILILFTEEPTLRSECRGWGSEDGDNVWDAFSNRLRNGDNYNHPNDIPVGLIRTGGARHYSTPLHAMGDGWKILAPPFKENTNDDDYQWWFVQDWKG